MNSIAVLLFALALVATLNFASASPKKQTEDNDTTELTSEGDNDETKTTVDGRAASRYRVEDVEEEEKLETRKSTNFKQHNAKLLSRLGMKRVWTNINHHRKRLASQSRSKYAASEKGGMDSQLFMVKLPPHSYFYDETQHPHKQQHASNSVNNIPVGFLSNGKPAKVYHWNLPTVKKALQGRYKSNDVFPIDYEPSPSKILPRRTLYYKPKPAGKPVKKSFINNGKPNSFYVVSKNNAVQPQFHKIVKTYYSDDN
ncbi:uncharacterized protein LOC126906408 [Daktulosphaira vitifoliae]|uniref:uncharacterized protein LOC126906408 n=1 Tax=Daktulosphaira vitifoliae TaxID=58002 RepID=UPI0021A9AC95|nr:uncharacterized protein LOC126906408 [Daktulosphaira vitifoliae]